MTRKTELTDGKGSIVLLGERKYCQFCRVHFNNDEFLDDKLHGNRACLTCAETVVQETDMPASSSYKDSLLKNLEESEPQSIPGNRLYDMELFGQFDFDSHRDGLYKRKLHTYKLVPFIKYPDSIIDLIDSGRDLVFPNQLKALQFIMVYAVDGFAKKRREIVSDLLVIGRERQLSNRQRYVLIRTLKLARIKPKVK